MNYNLVHLVMAIVIMALVSVAAYYIGGEFIGEDLIHGLQEGVASKKYPANTPIPELPEWREQYFYLVRYIGLAAGFILCLWVVLTHWLLPSTGQGKRWLRALFGIIIAAMCVGAPGLFVEYWKKPFIIEEGSMSLQLLFVGCYCLVGYWVGSIFVTSDLHKYAPIFAGFFR